MKEQDRSDRGTSATRGSGDSPAAPLISGFTVVRDARRLDYPIVESIRSILPIVDEFVVGVGVGEDGTRELIESIGDPKLRIFDSHWDMSRASGGRILSEKTNEALEQCRGIWCFYLQADEIIHEDDLAAIREACERYRDDARVEGLLFRYIHFYGGYDVISTSRGAYRNEVRIVRRSANPHSVGDAQSFLIEGERKAWVRESGATVYHYGWVKPPDGIRLKHENQVELYESRKYAPPPQSEARQMYGLRIFRGSHPAVMRDRVASQDWTFRPRLDLRQWNKRDYRFFLSDLQEKIIPYRFGERKKYRLLRD
jgi:hypothetical protein